MLEVYTLKYTERDTTKCQFSSSTARRPTTRWPYTTSSGWSWAADARNSPRSSAQTHRRLLL